jgi:hypothetical protein
VYGQPVFLNGAFFALGTTLLWFFAVPTVRELFPVTMLFIFWMGLSFAADRVIVYPYLWTIELLVMLRTVLFLVTRNQKSKLPWIPIFWCVGTAGFLLISNLTAKVDPSWVWVQGAHLKIYLVLAVFAFFASFFLEI